MVCELVQELCVVVGCNLQLTPLFSCQRQKSIKNNLKGVSGSVTGLIVIAVNNHMGIQSSIWAEEMFYFTLIQH